jgi:excisionase family DNA binding protein
LHPESSIAPARRFAMAEIMTVKELAKYLKMKEVTIYRCAQEGRLPGIKIRGQWRFDKNRIDQMINQSHIQRI